MKTQRWILFISIILMTLPIACDLFQDDSTGPEHTPTPVPTVTPTPPPSDECGSWSGNWHIQWRYSGSGENRIDGWITVDPPIHPEHSCTIDGWNLILDRDDDIEKLIILICTWFPFGEDAEGSVLINTPPYDWPPERLDTWVYNIPGNAPEDTGWLPLEIELGTGASGEVRLSRR